MSINGRRSGRQYRPRPTVPDLPIFRELVEAGRASIAGSAAPLKYRQEVLRNFKSWTGFATSSARDENGSGAGSSDCHGHGRFDPAAADGLREGQ